MKRVASLGMSVATAILMSVVSSSPAYAAYNCKGDKGLDVPMQFVAEVQGAGSVHVSAYGGSDKSGYVVPSGWRLLDAGGRQVDAFPKALVVFVSKNMLKETNLDGLVPGQSYTIELTSLDWCNKAGVVRKSITMPLPSGEANLPDLSTPTTVMVGLQSGQFKQIQFSLTDDAGIRRVTVSINGVTIQEYSYGDGVTVRWWCDNYPFDNTQSVLEGPYYYVSYPDTYKGTSSYVEIVAVDINGNESRQGASLGL
jgi:hypothetical protein